MLNNVSFHAFNRTRLLDKLPENSAVLVASGVEQIRNRDVEFPFRSESDFFYLTGFAEPDAVLLLVKRQGSISHLFLREKDSKKETWKGARLGVDAVKDVLSIDQAWAIDLLDKMVVELLEGIDSIYLSFAQLGVWKGMIIQCIGELKRKVRQGITAPSQLIDLDIILHEHRLIKSSEEITRIRRASQISVKGHLAAMQIIKPGLFEFQVQAELEAEFVRQGSQRLAFSSIVAHGSNACILHYTENRDEIKEGTLVLVDAGAEWQGYASDITTTFPANGTFSIAQVKLYNLVLEVQQAVIAMIKPSVTYDVIHQTSVAVMTQGLVDLGILSGTVKSLIQEEAYKAFFIHGTGHWLGMDVHDVGVYKRQKKWRSLEPGMVLTVEPGLYIPADYDNIAPQWQGIGIRIEDDILVTKSGYEVLTTGLPRTVAQIENWMSKRSKMPNKTIK